MSCNHRLPNISDLIVRHKIPKTKPPEYSFFWKLWNRTVFFARETLSLPYLQGIKNGTLNPDYYGGYNVADAYYCFKGADTYQTAVSHTDDQSPLQDFLKKKLEGYQNNNKRYPDTWHVSSAAAVTPPQITKEYADFEDRVARNLHPIYTLIVMIPCEYLWAWLASQMAPPTPGNVYAGWITDNKDPSGAYAMGNFLDMYMISNPGIVNDELAKELYSYALYYEFANFAAATGQSIKDATEYGLTPPKILSEFKQCAWTQVL